MVLTGKVAFITGGASGIGLACAKQFLATNIKGVALVDINDIDGNKVSKELNQIYPNKIIFIKTNVSDKNQVKEAFETAIKEFGNLDIVLNNAGVVNEFEPNKCYDVNIVGVTNCLQLAINDFLPKFKSKHLDGIVINLSSITALNPKSWFMLPTYVASKSAVLGLSMCYSHPYYYEKSGVKVIAICPGLTITALLATSEVTENEDLMKVINNLPTQKADVLGKNLIQIIEKAKNGSIWKMEAGLIEEIDSIKIN
nr:15-hydroxyprostaglandin dehydrogenase [NAD(+)]-like [Onthophagus taurus]